MDILKLIVESFWYLLPAYFANMAPVFFSRMDFLNIPVDFGKKIRRKPIFGANKTYRGFFFGILCAIAVSFLQLLAYKNVPYFERISLIDYSRTNLFVWGGLMGFGALFMDTIKSFFKRRAGIKPGRSWVPFDQLDYVVGALLFTSIVLILDWGHIITMILLSVALHLITTFTGYYTGIRKSKI